MDPYIVTAMIADTTILAESQADGLIKAVASW
jgi:hypothetical protein